MSKKLLTVGAALVVTVTAVAAFTWWPRGTTPVSTDSAVDDFRAASATNPGTGDGSAADTGTDATTDAESDDETPAARPEPGVYTYAAEGSEEVKLGPLPSQTRPHPDTVSGTVVHDGDSCFTLTLRFFEEHSEDTTYCAEGQRLSIEGHTKRLSIGALSPTAEMTCDPSVVVDAATRSSSPACTLRMSGGPAGITARLAGASQVAEPETVDVAGASVEVWPVTISYDVTDGLSGTWVETLWLSAETWLPVRVERRSVLSGLANLDEQFTLTLNSLDARR